METAKATDLTGCKVVMTRGVNDMVAASDTFAKLVTESVRRFKDGDWGDVSADNWEANDEALESLNNGGPNDHNGGWYSHILASYGNESRSIWIIRNTAEHDGTQAITVLFPDEY